VDASELLYLGFMTILVARLVSLYAAEQEV